MLTVPNALSVMRLLLIPVFVWLLLAKEADGWALAILFVSGPPTGSTASWPGCSISPRGWGLLDPAADRLYVVVTAGLRVPEILPWWLIAIIIARDVLLFATRTTAAYPWASCAATLYIGKARLSR